jgi:hypothetical protein
MVRILSEMEKCTSNINFDGCKGHYSWNFTCISLNRKEIQRVILIPIMQKFILRHIYIYLFLRDMVRILSEMEKCTSNINFDG